jgi:hypothetical protein
MMMNVRKFLPMIFLTLMAGCIDNGQSNSPVKNPTTEKSSKICNNQPGQPLSPQNVKSIALGDKDELISGMVSKDNQVGYSFEAKSGQTLQYKTDDEICVWIYSPDNKSLGDLKIAQDGKYLIQISAPKGSTSFNLKMSLKVIQVEAEVRKEAEPKVETRVPPDKLSSNPETVEQRDPEKFVRNYYAELNNRNYKYAWTDLSLGFHAKIGGFSEYTQFWDEVDRIQVNSVKSVSQGSNRATVDVDIQYKMKSGDTIQDDKPRIYLEWNSEERHWDIADKGAP